MAEPWLPQQQRSTLACPLLADRRRLLGEKIFSITNIKFIPLSTEARTQEAHAIAVGLTSLSFPKNIF